MALYPRRVTSTPTYVTVVPSDGTTWVNASYPPSVYKGSSSFTTLQAVYNSIGSAGGFAPLGLSTAPGLITTEPILANKGPIRSQMLTSTEYDQILGSRGSGTQDGMTFDFDGQTAVWESAVWNGYGWFWIPSGGHRTGYRNDMYLVRIADPMMCIRLYNPSPNIAATWRGGLPNPAGVPVEGVVPPEYWTQYGSDQLVGFPEWGPHGAHHYDGMQFDAATEKIIWGGDTPLEILNPTAYGQVRQLRVVLSVFDTNAATPKSAWSRHLPANWSGSTSIFGVVEQGNGWYEFSGMVDRGSQGKRYRYNPSTNEMVDTGPFITTGLINFGHAVRNPATGKVYESRPITGGAYDYRWLEIGGWSNLDDGLYTDGYWGDSAMHPIILNNKAYLFGPGAAASGVNKSIPLGVSRIDLATGVVDQLITNGLSVDLNVGSATANSLANGVNGLHGRVGYVPSVGAFVILLSALHDVYVFRPPTSWGAI